MSAPVIGHALHGNGPRRVLALHGWFGDHHSYDPILPLFDGDAYSIALMDQRGYGLSRDRDGPYDVATIAADALTLADHLGWERFSLIGHSMGGKAALKAATLAPERIEAVIGVTPVWAGEAPFDADTLAMFRAAATDAATRGIIIRHSTSNRHDDGWYAALVGESQRTASIEPFAAYFESWALDDFSDEVGGLSIPVQVIVGGFDQAITPELIAATWRTHLRNCSIKILSDASHYPMQECPTALAEALVDFLQFPEVLQSG